jgi:hypothetical protein
VLGARNEHGWGWNGRRLDDAASRAGRDGRGDEGSRLRIACAAADLPDGADGGYTPVSASNVNPYSFNVPGQAIPQIDLNGLPTVGVPQMSADDATAAGSC